MFVLLENTNPFFVLSVRWLSGSSYGAHGILTGLGRRPAHLERYLRATTTACPPTIQRRTGSSDAATLTRDKSILRGGATHFVIIWDGRQHNYYLATTTFDPFRLPTHGWEDTKFHCLCCRHYWDAQDEQDQEERVSLFHQTNIFTHREINSIPRSPHHQISPSLVKRHLSILS